MLAKHKVSKLGRICEFQFYTKRIVLLISSKELHQVVDAGSNGHLPKTMSTIYRSAELICLFIRQFSSKLDKARANIASEPAASTSTLVTGITTTVFPRL